MEEQLLKNLLRPLRRISPESAYMTRSKQLIAMTRQEAAVAPIRSRLRKGIFESMTMTAGLALASLLLLVAVGSLSTLTGSNTNGKVAASFNNDSLALEAQSADFTMQIQEISYFDESAKQVALVLDKISNETVLQP
jgi:hypothetical protein